ncbi:MAG: class B sortase [Clostridia bacterium]|nr:class B sortase [Clostridia bacterium]
MAGKHSKSIFASLKDALVLQIESKLHNKSEMSLPFKIITMVLVVSLLLSAVLIGRFFAVGNSQKKLLNNASAYFEELGGNEAIKTLSKENDDIRGWLNISGTDISCAVCQGEDDRYYTNHNQLGKKSRYGALALSSADSFERTGNDRNIVIFGNNMKDGTMFGSLKKYRNLNFYKQNPVIELYYGDTQEKYAIFAVMLVASYNDDAGDIYNPAKSHFADNDEFKRWYSESVSRSIIKTNVTLDNTDEMLTLVTSANDFKGARLVVLAKKVTDREASYINTVNAVVNGKIKYPKIWYTERGLEYPY